MTFPGSLPYDILLCIISKCDRSTMATACRISCPLLDHIRNLLYRRVSLRPGDLKIFLHAEAQFHRILHFSFDWTVQDSPCYKHWAILLPAIRENSKLISFKSFGEHPPFVVDSSLDSILEIDSLEYVAIHTVYASIYSVVRCPALKELQIDISTVWPDELPPTPEALRANLFSLSMSGSTSRSDLQRYFSLQQLQKLAICYNHNDFSKERMTDLIKATSSTLKVLSLWHSPMGERRYLAQDIQLPLLQVLVVSTMVQHAHEFSLMLISIMTSAFEKMPVLSELRLCFEWVTSREMAGELLAQLPSLSDFKPKIKKLHFYFSDQGSRSTGPLETQKIQLAILEKWGKGRDTEVNTTNDPRGHVPLTTFGETFEVADLDGP
ncbi:hypothetical protein DL96DRAFT_1817278 [Flagelloscypha sp. PMI_526]|nr:hypothetical protein DL96DRAFT_1817278 [Flagelloscypha sp. PMI_526]